MTHNEINERIAIKKGWKIQDMGIGSTPLLEAISPYGQYRAYPEELPQYTTDWRLAGELLEEIGHKSSVINVQADHTGYAVYVRKYPTDTAKLIMYHADTPQMAICLAFLEWSEG